MKNSLNIYLKVYIYLVIVRHIVKFIQTIIEFPLALSGILSMPILIWNTILGFTIVLILINILKIKKQALFSFYAIQVINVLVQSIIFDEDFGALAIVAVILCALMTTLLFLKKDGVSSWSLFFKDTNINLNNKLYKTPPNNRAEDIDEFSKSFKTDIKTVQEIPYSDTLESLPFKNDGSVDYDKMSVSQHFIYTCKIASVEVALKDLASDIKAQKKTIAKINKEIKSLSGGNRIKMRDLLRNEQAKLDELMILYKQYSSNKKQYKGFYPILFIAFIALIFIGLYIYTNANYKEDTNNVVNFTDNVNNVANKYIIDIGESIKFDSSKVEDELLRFILRHKSPRSILYSVLEQEGIANISTYEEYVNYFKIPENRKIIFTGLKGKGYSDFNTQSELDTYLGYENVCITHFVGEDIYDIPINITSDFEKQYPQSKIQIVIGNEIKVLPLKDIDSQDFYDKHPDFRFCYSISALSFPNEKATLNKRLLYYCLLATEHILRDDLGCIDDFLESINTDEKLIKFYWKLRNWGFLECEIGSVDVFISKIVNE